MPCYNGIKYLNHTLEVINNQTYKNFEVIFVDDGSEDDSIVVAKNFFEKHEIDYKIIKQKNSGVSIARNTGIQKSCGEYLYFLDCDDLVEESLCENLYEILKKDSIDILFFDYYIKKNDQIIKHDRKLINYNEIVNSAEAIRNLLNES